MFIYYTFIKNVPTLAASHDSSPICRRTVESVPKMSSAPYPANSSNDTGSHTREQTDGFSTQRPDRTACCARQGGESGRRASPMMLSARTAKERVLAVSERRSAVVSSKLWNILTLIGILWYRRFLLATIAESGSEQPHSSLSALGRNSH